jgi:hypothetical protein
VRVKSWLLVIGVPENKSWLVGVGVRIELVATCIVGSRNLAWDDCLVGRQLIMTITKLGVTKIATIMICYAIWIMKNATDTVKQALAIRALMGTGGDVHRRNFAKSTSGTLKIDVTIAIGISIVIIVRSRRHYNSKRLNVNNYYFLLIE